MTELGAGPALDQTLDFTVDTTGDIQTVSGSDELQKDIAFQLQILLQQYRGQTLNTTVRTDIQATTAAALRSDNRVQSVDEGTITVQQPDRETLIVQATARTDNGTHEFVIPVTNT